MGQRCWYMSQGLWDPDFFTSLSFHLAVPPAQPGQVTSNLPTAASASAKLCWGSFPPQRPGERKQSEGKSTSYLLKLSSDSAVQEDPLEKHNLPLNKAGSWRPAHSRHPWGHHPPLPGCCPGYRTSCPEHPLQRSGDDGQAAQHHTRPSGTPPSNLRPISGRHTMLGRCSNQTLIFSR